MELKRWKLCYCSDGLYKKLLIVNLRGILRGRQKIIFLKADKIPKKLVNQWVLIYKGRVFRKLFISKFIVGYRFGEFVLTRKPFKFFLKTKK